MEFLLLFIVLVADQATKIWAAQSLSTPLVLIEGVLELTFVKNTGAVWGIFSGARVIFIVVTVAFLAAVVYFYWKKQKSLTRFSRIILALIFAGALGNLIDRVALGYVRDMIYFSLINFPVFNIADSSIVVGAGLLIIDTFFTKDKRSTFDVLESCFKKKPKKDAE